MTKDKVFMK